jgi:hypothetical protein
VYRNFGSTCYVQVQGRLFVGVFPFSKCFIKQHAVKEREGVEYISSYCDRGEYSAVNIGRLFSETHWTGGLVVPKPVRILWTKEKLLALLEIEP